MKLLTLTELYLKAAVDDQSLMYQDQLEFLSEGGFSVPDVAHMLGFSVRTTERRLQEFNISSRQFFTIIDDQTLDRMIGGDFAKFPIIWLSSNDRCFLSNGIKVQQVRIRESMRRVNPDGILLKALTINTVQRRKYQVYAPLALWHVDGNHKLIRHSAADSQETELASKADTLPVAKVIPLLKNLICYGPPDMLSAILQCNRINFLNAGNKLPTSAL